jgi:D-glycero-alpha-D-manno-heptose-7-phosphate kinase
MILVRAPLRISLFGGGSDFKNFYKKKKSAVLSFSFNKYVYVIVKKSFSNNFVISYSKKETTKNIEKIKHPIIRETLKFFKIKEPLEIISISDIPGKGSGLGASSAFACALVKAIAEYKRMHLPKSSIAKIASIIEISKCNSKIGKQDHYASAIGGFNLLRFYSSENVKIKKIKVKKIFFQNLFLVPTNIYRNASKILTKQQLRKNTKNRNLQIDKLVKMAIGVSKIFQKNSISSLNQIGLFMHKGWIIKKKISESITNKKIDNLYNLGIKAGSTGGKLLGAGGGGFILFYVPKEKQNYFKKSFSNSFYIRPKLDIQGLLVKKLK